MTAFDTCYASVIKAEGGWSNDPADPGGITNWGVTKRAWEAWVGHPVTISDMHLLTPAIVAPFYRANYWNPMHGDSLPPALALVLFHCAVNAGPKRAAMLLQHVVDTAPDGALGPATIAAVAKAISSRVSGLATLITAFQDALREFYRSLHNFDVFGTGWLNRAADVQRQAEAMA